MWRQTISAILVSVILAGCNRRGRGSPATQAPPSPAVVDPWNEKLEQMRREYAANEAKMLADWRGAVKDAQAGDLDALKIDHEIQDLRQELKQNEGTLRNWDRQLIEELARRRGAVSSDN
jgi:hypothetical protein